MADSYPYENLVEAIPGIIEDANKIHEILTGDENTDVVTTGGYIPSFKKLQSQLEAAVGVGTIGIDQVSGLREKTDRIDDITSVKQFGAVGNGVVDDTTAIQNTINSLTSGGRIHLPAGTYKVSSTLTINKPCIFYGDGYSTNIQTNSSSNIVLLVSGAEQVFINNIRITSSVTRTGGWFVDVEASANRFKISDFHMDGACGGIRNNAVATCTIDGGQILNSVAGIATAIKIEAGLDVTIRDVLCDQGSQIFAGVHITNAGDISLEDLQIIHCGKALYVNTTLGKVVTSLWVNNSFFDNSIYGAHFLADSSSIVRTLITQSWFSSSSADGILLETTGGGAINGTDIMSSHVFLNGGHGVHIKDIGTTNTRIHDSTISQNTSTGIYVATNVNEASFQGNRVGASHGLTANDKGIEIKSGASDNIQVIGNDLRGNTTSNLVNGATGGSVIISDNLGVSESWTAYTPTITSGTGAITTLGAVGGSYRRVGKILYITMSIPITTNGTAALDIRATLPAGMAASSDFVLNGRENSVTGAMLQGVILATSNFISLTRYDNTYPANDGYRLIVSGSIEVQ